MRKVVLRNLLAHKVRLAMSGLAVVLGVAFVAGTLVFTDALRATFTALFEGTTADVNVVAEAPFGAEGPATTPTQPLPASAVDVVAAVDGVASATGYVQSEGVYVIGSDGKVVATGGAPGVGTSWDEDGGMTLVEGRAPRSADEVVLDETTAERTGFGVGDAVELLTPGPRVEAEVVGVLRFGDSGGLAGASLVAFDTTTAQALLAQPGSYTGIGVEAEAGTSAESLADRVSAALGAGYGVTTRDEEVEARSAQLEEALGFVEVFLLVFAGVALFVGSFIVLNTFSMLVAQRSRELALLRALGASRRQVTRSVLGEAAVLAVVGSTAGLASGVGVAAGLRALFGQLGLTLDGGLPVTGRTVAVAYAVGVVVTLVAAYLPARRSSRVPPVAALRDDQAMPERSLRVRTAAGALLGAAGAAATAAGVLVEDGGASLVGLGALALVLGAVALSPALARPFVRLLGPALRRVWGPSGRLARDNALRNPRRTAATASALMVGAALVSAFSIVGASADASIGTTVDETMLSDYVVSSAVGQPFSPEVAEQMAAVDGVERVGVSRLATAQLDGEVTTGFAADATVLEHVLRLEWLHGSASGLSDGGLVADEATAEDRGWSVGDVVEVVGVDGTEAELEVLGTYATNAAVGPLVLPLEVVEGLGGQQLDRWLFLDVAEGADAAQVRAAAEAVVADYPVVSVKDRAEFTAEQQGQVSQVLLLINAMLVLSVLIAVLGIVNTLALSVLERTREVGLLRAVGMRRRQLRRTVRAESVAIALFGAVLGLVLGTASGLALVSVLDGQGVTDVEVPVARLAGLVVLAAVVGVVAAAWPARRAARMPVLQAVATA